MSIGKRVGQIMLLVNILCLLTFYTFNHMKKREVNKFHDLGFEVYSIVGPCFGGGDCEREKHVINSCDMDDVTSGKISAEDLEYVNAFIKTDEEPVVLKLKYKGCNHSGNDITYYFTPDTERPIDIAIEADKVIKIEQFFSE